MATGQATLDFGAFPGATDASVAVTGLTGILSGSLVEAWIFPATTTDHTADEHLVETFDVLAGSVVAGVGFTIYGVNYLQGAMDRGGTFIYGKWNVAWAYL